jgi:DNA-directed RNA polymerase subunit RPC12/RpoP
MDDGIGLNCRNCDYNFSTILGVGMRHSSLENVIDLIHYKRRRKVLNVLREHPTARSTYEHKLYRCNKCGGFYGRFWAKIEDRGTVLFETVFKCSKCRKELAEIKTIPMDNTGRITSYSCPKCHKKSLYYLPVAPWD